MIAESAAAKIVGALLGTLLSLVFIPPRTKRGFFRRATAALIVGPVSAPFIAPWLAANTAIEPGYELHLGSAAAGAFCSWWALGLIKRGLEKISAPQN